MNFPRQIVTYTMGKVGSQSIDIAAESAGLPSYHIHTLDRDQIDWQVRWALDRKTLPPGHIATSMYLLQHYLKNPLYVSCLRDPMARNLSAFFQNLDRHTQKAHTLSPEQLFAKFERAYKHDNALTWFDREWKEHLGIDVYTQGEPLGDHAIKGDKFILFRDSASNAVKSEILSDLMGRQVTVGAANIGEAKAHGDTYAKVKAIACASDELLDHVYSSAYARRFWTESQIAGMRAKWSAKVPA